MSCELLSSWVVGDTTVRYLHDAKTGCVGLQLVPTALLGDSYHAALAQGHTLRSVPANADFRFASQTHKRTGDRTKALTWVATHAP